MRSSSPSSKPTTRRTIARGPGSAPPSLARRVVQRAVKPKSVMVWAGVGHDKKTPLIFVAPGVKINGAFYREMLEREVVPWMDALPDPLVFQQDGAPAHTAKETQDWCQAEFFDFVRKSEWPPSSPDLNPMDFSIWSILEARACANPHKSVESLINALKREWEKLDQETIRRRSTPPSPSSPADSSSASMPKEATSSEGMRVRPGGADTLSPEQRGW
jgi:hypothetical protein